MQEQLDSGLTTSLETELSVDDAELLNQVIPLAKAVKISNTGTEAVMHALQIVRGHTKRSKVVKTEDYYHGWHDEMNLSVHPTVGSGVAS